MLLATLVLASCSMDESADAGLAKPTPATNNPPSISGNPPRIVKVGVDYSFTAVASDPDGDTLVFTLQNEPAWLLIDSVTGTLSGIPQAVDLGTHAQIAVSVSDGLLSASLPLFSITVSSANLAPQISGTPTLQVDISQFYSFTPTASDPDGDTLTFSILNSPSWASLDTTTGTLSGTPLAGDEGNYTNIVISVDDGSLAASLTAFDILVNQVGLRTTTLIWTPPTQNSDGSFLTDLTGYVLHYGTNVGNLNIQIPLNDQNLSSYIVTGLSPGTYFFGLKAVNSQDVESEFSNVATKTIN